MHDLMARATRDRTGYLALLEMRLEATRRPELLASYTKSVRGDLEEAMEFHRTAGLPGGDEPVIVLYLAMLGLLLEHLTLPGVLDGALPGVGVPDGLVERIVATVLPEEGRAGEASGARAGHEGSARGLSRGGAPVAGPRAVSRQDRGFAGTA